MSMVLKPAERVDTDWKMPMSARVVGGYFKKYSLLKSRERKQMNSASVKHTIQSRRIRVCKAGNIMVYT